MLRNYLKVAFRTLRRSKGYTAISVGGLAVSIACALVALLYVNQQLSYDDFHKDAGHLYRVHDTVGQLGAEWASTPWSVADMLREEYGAGVKVARVRAASGVGGRVAVRQAGAGHTFTEEGFLYADSTFFDVLTFPLKKGDPSKALDRPNALVLTEETASKYFGAADPLGATLRVNGDAFTVTGVMQTPPEETHLNVRFIASMSSIWNPLSAASERAWTWNLYYTYVKATRPELVPAAEAALSERRSQVLPTSAGASSEEASFDFVPVTDLHLRSDAERALSAKGSLAVLRALGLAAFLLLLVASVNFVNLATAHSMGRAREVGVRKASGASRRSLMGQFLGESLLLASAAGVVAVPLAAVALRGLRAAFGLSVQIDGSNLGLLVAALVGIVVLVGLGAGLYPALVLSRFEPARVLKGTLDARQTGASSLLRKGLVAGQFAVASVLIIGSFALTDQLNYVLNADLGIEEENVLVVPVQDRDEMESSYASLRAALQAVPTVRSVAASSSVPGQRVFVQEFTPEARTGTPPGDATVSMRRLAAGRDFIETYGLKLRSGRAFSDQPSSDSTSSYLINEAAAEKLGWRNPLGKRLRVEGREGRVVGVVENFNYASLRNAVEPLVIEAVPLRNYISIRFSGAPEEALPVVENAWRSVLPASAFDYYFLEEKLGQLYETERTLRNLVWGFVGLTFLVACMGLIGLSAFVVRRRRKEVAIRKSLGASMLGVTTLLSKDFLRPVALGFLLSLPVAYFAVQEWRQRFAYQADLDAGLLLWPGAIVHAVALFTVGMQVVRAAQANPAQALRDE